MKARNGKRKNVVLEKLVPSIRVSLLPIDFLGRKLCVVIEEGKNSLFFLERDVFLLLLGKKLFAMRNISVWG